MAAPDTDNRRRRRRLHLLSDVRPHLNAEASLLLTGGDNEPAAAETTNRGLESMKKIAIVMLVVAAALAGCGKKKSTATPTPPAGEGSAAPAEGSAAPAEGSAAPAGDAPPAGG